MDNPRAATRADDTASEISPPGQRAARTGSMPPGSCPRSNAASLVPLTELFRSGVDASAGQEAEPTHPGRTAAELQHRSVPCGPCPFRRDAPLGVHGRRQRTRRRRERD
jgi:hypothetical protein